MKKTTFLLPIVAVIIAAALSSMFIVDEREKALVLQFGQIKSVKEEPGLAFKLPLIQEVVRYDDRILSRDIDPLEVTPLDDRRLVVDAFARYRITDVERFRQAVGVGGIASAEDRLDSILRSQTREILGSVASNDILSSDRAALMLRIRNGAVEQANELGIEIIDVRLKRTDLPSQNLEAPTGIGKTVASLHPAMRHALGHDLKIFVLTAKTLQQEMATAVMALLNREGTFRSLRLRAKSKMCANDQVLCHEDYCPYARDYYLKLQRTRVVPKLLEEHDTLLPDQIFAEAKRAEACPFEISLELGHQ
ncbi:MAG: SPFH domain-containing protein, partial [Pseudomonadota bacterium]